MSLSIGTSGRGLLTLTAVLLAGCARVPDLGAKPELSAPTRYEAVRSFAGPVSSWPSDRWWESYGDSQLNALIEEALASSPSLAAAAARVHQAEAVAAQAGASRFPTLTGQGSVSPRYQHVSADNIPATIGDALPNGYSTRSNVQLLLSYQLDFFGRNQAAFAAATSTAKAADAEAAAARLQLSTAVATSYAELRRYASIRAAAADIVRLRDESAGLVKRRLQAGLEREGQAQQATAELEAARADLAAADGAIAATRNALAALLGKGPDRGLEVAVLKAPTIASAGLPEQVGLDLIGRRPDIVAARLNAEAASKRIDVAHADFYPNVNISGLASLQTLGLSALSGGILTAAQIGPAITLPIFEGGRIEGAYREARGAYDEAVALYDQTLANALRDVATAVGDRRALESQLAHERAALSAAEKSYRAARSRYEGGVSSYIDTLSIENSLVAQRRAVADLEAQAFALDIALVRALGGGFKAA